jgi:hypothetical protein
MTAADFDRLWTQSIAASLALLYLRRRIARQWEKA